MSRESQSPDNHGDAKGAYYSDQEAALTVDASPSRPSTSQIRRQRLSDRTLEALSQCSVDING